MQQRDESLSRLLSVHNLQTNLIRNCIHEIKSPLGGISGYADLMEITIEGDRDLNKIGRYRNQIVQGLDEVNNIVDQIREIAKQIVTVRPGEIYAKADVSEVIRLVCSKMENLSRYQENYLEFTDSAGVVELPVDKLLLRLVVMNLIANAIKYTAKRESVQVQTAKSDSIFLIQIKSSETKLPSETLERMFFAESDHEFGGNAKTELNHPYYFASDCIHLIHPCIQVSVDSRHSFSIELQFDLNQIIT